jgi:hypothetical protein
VECGGFLDPGIISGALTDSLKAWPYPPRHRIPEVGNDPGKLDMALLPGARALLEVHNRELPQRDDLCGAFCAALALRGAGIDEHDSEPIDQDAVALAAGSLVSASADGDSLPAGEQGRRDYRLSLPFVKDGSVSGTTAGGLIGAVAQLSNGALSAIPYTGRWTAARIAGLFDLLAALERPVALVANYATRHLWGSHADVNQLLSYLIEGDQAGPEPDWDVGHFVCLIGRIRGPGGSLYGVVDTYPSLGRRGVHLQPEERLALALERPGGPGGGMIAIVSAEDGPTVRAGAGALGLLEGVWDNGTATLESSR